MNLLWIKMKNSACDALKSLLGDLSGFLNLFFARVYLAMHALLIITTWSLTRVIEKKAGSEQAILHYNIDFGVNLIDSAEKIYAIPLLGLAIFMINFFLSAAIYKQSGKFIAHALLSSAFLAGLLLLAGLASLFLINFR